MAPTLLNQNPSLAMELASPAQPSPRTLDPLALKSVLLVDDDKQLASALQWILEDENFLVDIAYNGEEAMLKIEALEYDVIVCDLLMPRLRGDEFYHRVMESRPHLRRRFVFITGHAADAHVGEFLRTYDVDFLVKPFPVQRLIKRVRDLIVS